MKPKLSKRFKKLLEISEGKKIETIEEAIKKVKKNCTTKFDESIDVSFNLNIKQKKDEVTLRTSVNLPNGNGKKIKDLNAFDIKEATKIICGSARSMGIEVKN